MGDTEAAATTEGTTTADSTALEPGPVAAGEGAVVRVDQLKTTVEALVHQALQGQASVSLTVASGGGQAALNASGIGSMPPADALRGLPTIDDGLIPGPLSSGDDASRPIPPGISIAAALANLLPKANESLVPNASGVYVREGLAPVPAKLAARILRGEFIEMGELLPEFWPGPREEEAPRSEAKMRKSRKVTDLLTWLQCYGTYVSVVASVHPSRVPELMAYMITIIRVSQDFTALAWVRYDAAFRRQAALTGNTKWSQVNVTLYSTSFAGLARFTARCELCLATSHMERDCTLQGTPDPNVRDRLKVLKSLVLAIAPKQPSTTRASPWEPSSEPCRLWNENRCTFAKCRPTHVCSNCRGRHQRIECPLAGQQQLGPARGPAAPGRHGPPYQAPAK